MHGPGAFFDSNSHPSDQPAVLGLRQESGERGILLSGRIPLSLFNPGPRWILWHVSLFLFNILLLSPFYPQGQLQRFSRPLDTLSTRLQGRRVENSG